MYQPALVRGETPIGSCDATTPSAYSKRPNLAGLVSFGISLLLLTAVAYQIRGLAFGTIWHMVPRSAAFWLVFAVYYLAGPMSEWFIYRRLWSIPVSGVAALLRKLVSNELLMGYLGEVQFYAWARKRTDMANAPFGSIKDVTILSALVGNAVTLAMLLLAWPLLRRTQIGLETRTAFLSLTVILLTSMVILIFRHRIFSLPTAELRRISGLHLLRVLVILGASALMWHLVLHAVPLAWWVLLATFRMLVSRLPLVPNKDVVFAGISVFLLGHEVQIGELMTMMAGIILVTHLGVGAVLGAADIANWSKRR
jgi:hypothetical protein